MIDDLISINKYWGELCKPFSPLLLKIEKELEKEYNSYNVFPPKEKIFRGFDINPQDVTTVILSQDPYVNTGEANGIAFSSDKGIPPSLQIMFNELERTYNKQRFNADLRDWMSQGVMLLNTTLTVRRGKPGSHEYLNWKALTGAIIKYLYNKNVIILCFGSKAVETVSNSVKTKLNDNVLVTGHPAADARSSRKKFFGSNIFYECNKLLEQQNKPPINWVGDDYEESIYSSILRGINT